MRPGFRGVGLESYTPGSPDGNRVPPRKAADRVAPQTDRRMREGARASPAATATPGPGTRYLKRPGPPCPRPTPSFEAELAMHGDRDLLRPRARVVHAVRRDLSRVRLGDLEHSRARRDDVTHAPA